VLFRERDHPQIRLVDKTTTHFDDNRQSQKLIVVDQAIALKTPTM